KVATLLVAVEIFASVEPTTRPLVDVAAERAEVANQGRSDTERGLRQQRKLRLQILVLDDFAECRGRTNVRSVGPDFDALEIGDRGQVDDLDREGLSLALDPVLHDAADQIAATTERFAGGAKLVEHTDGLLDRG